MSKKIKFDPIENARRFEEHQRKAKEEIEKKFPTWALYKRAREIRERYMSKRRGSLK